MPACQCDMHGRGKACHCRTCCLTFSGPSAFDAHLNVRELTHKTPADSGLVEVRPGVWGRPGNEMRTFPATL